MLLLLSKGTTNGTITGLDGDFSISNVEKGDVVVVSYVGYVDAEIVWSGKPLRIVLKEGCQKFLDEVVVVGYGTQKKVNVTGSVGMVGSEVVESPSSSECVPGSSRGDSWIKCEYYK